MSTKTTFKRVALVAVASMGFGMLSVVSASANTGTLALAASTGGYGTVTPTVPVAGTAVSTPILVTSGGTSTLDDSFTFTGTLTVVPTNSALVAANVTASTTGFGVGFATTAATSKFLTSAATNVITVANNTTASGLLVAGAVTGIAAGSLSFTPDVPGLYTLTITNNAAAVRTISFNVSGSNIVQAFAGKGATAGVASGTQITGRSFAAAVLIPAGSVAGTSYQITAVGATITGINTSVTETNAADASYGVGTTTGISKINGTDFAAGATYTGIGTLTASADGAITAVAAETLLISAQAAAAGTAYIYIKSANLTTGVLTTVASTTVTMTITSSGDTAINKAQSTISLQSAACPAAAASKSADVANYATNAASGAKAAAGLIHVCIVTRDGNGTAIAVTTASQIVTSLGYIGTTATPSVAAVAAAAASSQDMYLLGVSTMTGAATVTATLIDAAGNAISLSTPVTFYGSLATMKLANKGYAAQYLGAATFGAATSGKGYLKVYGYDSAGNQIDFNDAANSTGTFTVDSSAVSTAAAARTSDSAGGSVATAFASGDVAVNYGYNRLAVSCESSASEEKLTITAWGKDSLGAWVSSNSVDFYCSDNAVVKGVITVTPADASVVAGGATTVNFKYVDSVGYPVPDGTAVSLSASNGAGVNTPSTTTLNGAFYYPANVVAGSNGPISLLAVGTLATSGTASIAVTGGSQEASSAAADAAAEATDAANAATDAANAAAEAADAATAAAQDASDAVAALSEQFSTLVASIKAQITSLTALIVKIQKKMKA